MNGNFSRFSRPRLAVLAAALLALSACAAHQAHSAVAPGAPGFLLGVWHGFIFPIAWFISLFTDVTVYAVPNNGGWYNFGYFIGIVFLGVGSHGSRKVVVERNRP